jgi:serine protease Do
VIIRFDGRDIKESRDLPRIVGQTAVGKEVDVVVIREGKEKSLRVTLGRLEDGEKLAQQGNGAPTPEAPVVKKALGLELSSMTDEVRKRYSIKETVKGVVVTKVDPDSAAGEKRIAAGDVITEVQQEAVQTPDALVKRIAALKKEGKKSALFLVSSAQGDMRFVALPLE